MARVWVVAADAARARVFESANRTGHALREVETWVNPEVRQHAQALGADRPGRVNDSSGPGRHAMEPPTDLKEVEAERFARELAKWLDQARNEQRFEHLVIAAPPHFLGQIRHSLSAQLRAMVSSEVGKDLCHLERPEQVREHLPDFLC
ncbi:host attachment protein [Halorhodospira neutriphila]|uniref:Host attachment protein n=1 Tax=Halorhodospira neutriphila TaxID=168379 RepID=A0ABS1E4A0_9GAMM|nr:host attachment protein [Halorhodospira neutriphila]MBK1726570.1 hypothetical protein [Halorhodospira neutriphila]